MMAGVIALIENGDEIEDGYCRRYCKSSGI